MPVRRTADPITVQYVWDGIRSANAQRQTADLMRIAKYVQRFLECSQIQAEQFVQQVVNDGLIVEINKTASKGEKAGMKVQCFKIPMQELAEPGRDGKDWYCIDCHLAGDVTLCRLCHRVFHQECARTQKSTFSNFINANINGTVGKKRVAAVPESTQKEQNGVILESIVIDDTEERDTNLNHLVDDVERKLEKMEGNGNASVDEDLMNANRNASINTSRDESNNTSTTMLVLNNCRIIYDDTLCNICNICKNKPDIPLEQDELNHLLTFVHSRIRTWIPLSITDTVPPEAKPEWHTEAETSWRAKQLFYHPMNMAIMEMKLQTNEYKNLLEFVADVLSVKHNIAIYHGIKSQEFECANFLWQDCRRELSELSKCVDCYKHSNEKINSKWFCLPCRVPHRLVWAKQKGYPYWPAKVIKETEEACDVRFFGGKYERSVLPKMYIKPIEINMAQQVVKKSAAFNKSVEELAFHQKLLCNPTEVQKCIAASRKKARPSSSKFSTVVTSATISPKKRKSRSIDSSKEDFSGDDSYLTNTSSSNSSLTQKRKRSESPVIERQYRSENSTVVAAHTQNNKTTADVPNQNGEIINLSSDLEDQNHVIAEEDRALPQAFDGGHQEVSSSTEHNQLGDDGYVHNVERSMPQTERQYSEAVEKTRRMLEQCHDRKQMIKVALECMQAEIDRIKDEHDDYLKKVFEAHNTQISETKKKQWCFNCEQDAIYHCCWNTAYCSPTCQQQHWQAEHKKVCRRKR